MLRLALVLFALSTPALPLLAAPPADASRGAAVVFAPWTDQAAAFARIGEAGGAVVRAGAFPFIAVAAADDPRAFARAVSAAGAWALLDPGALGGCLAPEPTPAPPGSLPAGDAT